MPALPACTSGGSNGWFSRPKSSSEWLDLALDAEHPDDRRRGIIGLAKSRDGAADWAMTVYDTVARTDHDAMVRCAALQAMAKSAGDPQVPTALGILNSTTQKEPTIRPAPGSVRWEAAKLLLRIVDRYAYAESRRQQIVDTLLQRLAGDPDRNVRLTVIDALAYFAQEPVPDALVEVLEEDDFALKNAAESALISLTGTTQHHDPIAWRQWLAETPDPFVNAGQAPAEVTADSRSKWQWPW